MSLLQVEGPFDLALTTARFRAFGVDRANVWHEGGLHRVVGGREVRIEAAPGGVEVEPLDAETEPVVRKLLGLEFELEPFYEWTAGVPELAELPSRFFGFRPTLAPDPFEMLVGAVTAQQVSLFAAVAIRNRLIERFGARVGVAWAFPTRERLAVASEDELVAVGFSRRKAEYVVGLARSDLDLDALAPLPDEEVKARLTAVRGLGEWTADWFLARHLGRPRAWPAGDLALRKAVRSLYGEADVRARRRAIRTVPEPDRALPARPAPEPVIRPATADDLPLVRELWQAFEDEIPDEPWRPDDLAEDVAWLEEAVRDEIVLLADEDGLAVARRKGERLGFLEIVYVRPAARRKGLAAELVREVAKRLREAGAEMLELEVLASNAEARAIYDRWGFKPVELTLGAPLAQVEQRLATADGPTFGAVHVQTDDADKVRRDAVKMLRFEPEIQVGEGWVRVRSDATDEDPARLKALAKELSYTSGGVVLSLGVEVGAVVRYDLFDRGADVDEYLVRAGVLRAAAAGRRVCDGLQPDGRRAPHRRRREARPRGGADGPVSRRAAAGPGALRADRGRHGSPAVITLYDAARCPYCARVRIVLVEKRVEVDVVEIDLAHRPGWLYEKNPSGKVPVLEEDGRPLPESAVIMEFLEERYPEPPLLPPDPADRAFARLQVFLADEFTDPYYAFRRGEDGAREQLDLALDRLDAALAERPFLGGAEYGLADIAYVPWLLRARDMLDVDLAPFAALSGWLERLLQRPAVAAELDIVAAL